MAVLAQVHLARQQLANAQHQFERADAIWQIDHRISEHMDNREAIQVQSKLDRVANQTTDLFGVDYQISEQRAYAYAAEFSPGEIQLHQSVMKLRFGLLHEDDLMRFFNALGQSGAGIFYVDQCVVKRIDPGAALRYQPNLNAECELSWITARPVGGERRS